MKNEFNVFALFFPRNITATLLVALQVNQIYLASQYLYPGLREDILDMDSNSNAAQKIGESHTYRIHILLRQINTD